MPHAGNLFLLSVIAATPVLWAEDAAEILKKTGDAYRNAQSFHFEGQTTAETKTENTVSTTQLKFDCALLRPGKVRVEYEYPNAGNWIRVSDGKTFTTYRSMTDTLAQSPATPEDVRALNGTPIADFERIDQGVLAARIVGSEPLQVAGDSIDCHVLEVQYGPGTLLPNTARLPTKYWIDKNRFIVLQRVSGTKGAGNHPTVNTRTVTLTRAEINSPVDDGVFAFRKP